MTCLVAELDFVADTLSAAGQATLGIPAISATQGGGSVRAYANVHSKVVPLLQAETARLKDVLACLTVGGLVVGVVGGKEWVLELLSSQSVCLLSLFLCMRLSVCLSMSLSVCLCFFLFVSVSLSDVCLSLSSCLSLSVSQSACLTLRLSLTHSLSLSLSLSHSAIVSPTPTPPPPHSWLASCL